MMLEQVGHFIGMAAADVVHFFRGRQAVPCLVDWDKSPFNEANWPVTIRHDNARYYSPPSRPDVQAVFGRDVQQDACCGGCDNGCWN